MHIQVVRAICCGLFAWIAHPAQGQVSLIPLTNVWNYEQTRNLDGTNWTARNFDDATWPQGPALLYFEDNTNVAPKMTPLIPGRDTYYFRTRFSYPPMPAGSGLSFSNLVDDGAVIYLNAVEIRRIRMAAAPALISYTNRATGSGSEGNFDVFTVPAESLTNLIEGDNVLAVEVHQVLVSTNADIVFGCAVSALAPQAPTFTILPTNTAVLDGRSTRFFASAVGYPAPTLQWFKDGQALTNATNSTLILAAAFLSDGGAYTVLASNEWGSATSTNATLAVIPDTNGPLLLTAVGSKDLIGLVATFSEPVAPSTVVPASFELVATGLPEHRREVRSAVLTGGTNVVLTTDAREYGINYILRANGVGDATSATNSVANTAGVPLQYVVEVVSLNSSNAWSYFQAGREPEGNWRDLNFDDSSWSVGAPLFYRSATSQSVPAPVGTTLTLTNLGATNAVITYYFRKKFAAPGLPDGNGLRLRHIVDDGAVFYVNGDEIHSIGMATNRPAGYNDLSVRVVSPAYEPATFQAPFSRAANVLPQENIVAVEVHQAGGGIIDAAFGAIIDTTLTQFFPQVQVELPPFASEAGGTIPNAGRVTLRQPWPSNLAIRLTSGDTNRLWLPEIIIVPAGGTNVTFDLTLIDNAALEGPRQVTVSAFGSNVVAGARSILVTDDESTTVGLVVPPFASEGGPNITGMVTLGAALSSPVEVRLSTTASNVIALPGAVVVPAGQTSAVFTISIPQDVLIEGTQPAIVVAQVPGWPSASATIQVSDDELARLTLVLPTDLREGDGLRAGAGTIRASGILTSNLTVHLQSSDPAELVVPSTLMIPAGQSNAFFDISVGDDALFNGRRTLAMTANASGFVGASNLVSVADNELHRFTFSPVASPQSVGVEFSVTITARTIDGEQLTSFNASTGLSTMSSDGPVPFAPATAGPFVGGQWTGSITVSNAARLVRLRTEMAPGESAWFYVEPPMFRVLAQANSDIAWHEGSGTLFATVPPSGGLYSNKVVAIDPVSATVTNSYAIGGDPTQMELSGNGQFMYVALSNRNALARFNLINRSTTARFGTGNGPVGPKWIRDFAVIGGAADSVAATFADSAGNSAGTWRYTSGAGVELNTFSTLDPNRLESSPTTNTLYGFHGNNSFPLMRGAAVPGSALTVTNTLVSHMFGNDIIYRFGVLYDNSGHAVQADTFAYVGFYPGLIERFGWVALPETDPVRNRVVYLVGGYSSLGIIYKIRAFDRTSFTPLAEIRTPNMSGSPQRFLRLGTNGFAYNAGGGQIWFVRSETIQPTQPPADLVLTQTASPLPPIAGSNVIYSLSLSNNGPNLATSVRVSNALPANVTVVSSSSSTGAISQAGDVLVWSIAELAAQDGATLQFTLQHSGAGWHTNRAVVTAYEPDLNFVNNVTSLTTFVQLPSGGPGTFVLNLPVEDMVYDPVRDRLLLSVTNAGGAYTNGLIVFNQNNGTVESFVPLGRKPAKLARSDDGQFLYVSLKEDALVRRLHLSSLTTSLQFGLGGDTYYDVFYPYYAADFAVLPGNSGSLAVWRVRRAGPMAEEFPQGVGIYDQGILRSNVTANRLTYALEFDTHANTLYALTDDSRVHRCVIDSNGVSFAQDLLVDYSGGRDIQYVSGRLVTARGRVVDLGGWRVTGIYSGVENGILVEPDGGTGRVYFLVNAEGAWRLSAYDLNTFDPVGSLTIPNVTGVPTTLIRWGSDGLAFRTDSGQLIIVRHALVAPNVAATADLRTTQAGPDQMLGVGSNMTFTVTVTNQGPAVAESVILTNRLLGSISNVAASCSAGTCTVSNNTVRWLLSSMAAGEEAFLSITGSAGAAGTVTSVGSVSSVTDDPALNDNLAMAVAQVVSTTIVADRIVGIQLSTRDLIWDSRRSRILATTGTNMAQWAGGVVSIDPESGQVAYAGAVGHGANEMALSDDGTKLFVGVDYGVQEINPASMSRGTRYATSPNGFLSQSGDIEAVPGDSSKVVVSSMETYTGTVALYDGGLIQSNALSLRSSRLEFSDVPNRMYAVTPGVFFGGYMQLRSIELDTNGLTEPSPPLEFGAAGDVAEIHLDTGRIYTGGGYVLDEMSLEIAGAFPSMPSGALVLPEVAAGRVFFLAPEGATWVLSAWDPGTFRRLGSVRIPAVSGIPTALIRWGADGLAFRTSGDQVFLVRSSLVPTNAATDLAVTILESADPVIEGSNVTFTVAITNRGPRTATSTRAELDLPASATLLSLSVPQGTVATNGQSLTLSLGDVPVGGVVQFHATMRPNVPAVLDCRASVISRSEDTNNADNIAIALVIVQSPGDVGPITALPLTSGDIIWEPSQRRIYATVPESVPGWGNSIVAIDPERRSISSPMYLGSNPRKLARSGDGQSLYIGLDRASAVLRFDLPEQSPREHFSLGPGQRAEEILISPDMPGAVVVRRWYDNKTAIYDHGVMRPTELSGLAFIGVSDTTGKFYGVDVYSDTPMYRLDARPTGLFAVEPSFLKPFGIPFRFENGLCYFASGRVIDPETQRVEAEFPVIEGKLVAPDAASGRAYFLRGVGVNANIVEAYDQRTFVSQGAVTIPGLSGPAGALIRCGGDQLALQTPTRLFLIRSPLVPTNPPTDIGITMDRTREMASVGEPVGFSLVVTNHGGNAAIAAAVDLSLSAGISNVTVSASHGSVSNSGGNIRVLLGTFPNHSVAMVTVAGVASSVGTVQAVARLTFAGNDSNLANNVALAAIGVSSNGLAPAVFQIRLATKDLAYDPVSGRLFASIPPTSTNWANHIVPIDPSSGQIEGPWFAGADPGKMAISEGGEFLYVSINGEGAIRRRNMSSGEWDLRFPVSTNGVFLAPDLEVQPGHPETIAASSQKVLSYGYYLDYPSAIAVYDHGLPRATNSSPYGSTRFIEFSPDGSRLYGSIPSGQGFGFLTLSVGENGIVNGAVNQSFYYDADFEPANGLLYTPGGRVIDPNIPTVIGTNAAAGPMTADASSGRVFYVVQNGSVWELRAFAIGTYQLLGTEIVPGLQGTPLTLVRAGSNRFALRTSSDQLLIIRSALVPPTVDPPADLTVTQTAHQDLTLPADKVVFSIAVSNRGPGYVTAINLADALPAPIAASSVQVSQGTVTANQTQLIWRGGALSPGAVAQMQITAVVTNTGILTNLVSVSGSVSDPDLRNNVSLERFGAVWFQQRDSVRKSSLRTLDLAYDRFSDRLFATLAETNLLVWFDPKTARIAGSLPMAAAPDRLAISDDGQHLYVSFVNTSLIQRVHLPSSAINLTFNLGGTPPSAMLVVPGQSGSLAVSWYTSSNYPTAIFDNSTPRPLQVDGYRFTLLAAQDSTNLIGYSNTGTGGASPDLFRMSLSAAGATFVESGPSDTPFIYNRDVAFVSDRLYFASGDVIRPSGWVQETPFATAAFGIAVEINSAANQAIFLDHGGTQAAIYIFNLITRQNPMTLLLINGVYGAGNLTLCGSDRFAFRSHDEVIFVRTSVIPAADLQLSSILTTTEALAGQNVTISVTLSNAGPATANGVAVTNLLPSQSRLISASASRGTLRTNGNRLSVDVGAFNPGAIASITVVVQPTNTTDFVATNTAFAVRSNPEDPFLQNDITNKDFFVWADSDRDRLPDTWESARGFNPGDPYDAAVDADNDGHSNLDEYRAGTDPLDPENVLRIGSVRLMGNFLELQFHSVPGRTYSIEEKDNLSTGTWTPRLSAIQASSELTTVNIAVSPSAPRRFYRARLSN